MSPLLLAPGPLPPPIFEKRDFGNCRWGSANPCWSSQHALRPLHSPLSPVGWRGRPQTFAQPPLRFPIRISPAMGPPAARSPSPWRPSSSPSAPSSTARSTSSSKVPLPLPLPEPAIPHILIHQVQPFLLAPFVHRFPGILDPRVAARSANPPP